MEVKNMSAFREFNNENAQCDLWFKSLCTNFNMLTKFFKLRIALRNYKMEVLKTSSVVYIFKVLWSVSTH